MKYIRRLFLLLMAFGVVNLSYSQSHSYSAKGPIPPNEKVNPFENFTLQSGYNYSAKIEYPFIKRGDSIRIKHLFNKDVKLISSRYLGREIPYECLKKGEWIITIKPDTTQWVDFKIEYVFGNASANGFLIVVIEPEKYDDVKKEYDKVKDDFDQRTAFLEKLWKVYSKKSFSEYYRAEWERLSR